MLQNVYAFSDTFLKHSGFLVANKLEPKQVFSMTDNAHQPTSQQRYKQEITDLVEQLNPNDIEIIPLTKGYCAIVDRKFSVAVKKYEWFSAETSASVYAKSGGIAVNDGRQVQVGLHNFIVSVFLHGKYVLGLKHTTFNNKNPLDCRLSNLLNGNDRQTVMRNRIGKRGLSSQYKGVHKDKSNFRVQIHDGDTQIYLGKYDNELAAAAIYDAAAFIIFGAAAHYNLPLGSVEESHRDQAGLYLQRHYSKKAGRPMSSEEIINLGLNIHRQEGK